MLGILELPAGACRGRPKPAAGGASAIAKSTPSHIHKWPRLKTGARLAVGRQPRDRR